MRRALPALALAALAALTVLTALPPVPAAGVPETAPGAETARTGVAARTWPAYVARVHRVTRHELGKSWHHGCPVGPSGLRQLTVRYTGFDRRPHLGRLVVATSAVPAVRQAMHSLYRHRFPIRRMRPIAAYGGSDNRSMRHDNTSAFNCRYAVANGPKTWSEHAYGQAIDIDPVENPYVLDGRVRPAKGKPYADRSQRRRGMIEPGGKAVRAFAAVGWGWGGNWSSSPDWQHFSSTGT